MADVVAFEKWLVWLEATSKNKVKCVHFKEKKLESECKLFPRFYMDALKIRDFGPFFQASYIWAKKLEQGVLKDLAFLRDPVML